jgi:hypothetical protein
MRCFEVISTQKLSCYCDACVNGQNSEFENVDIVRTGSKETLTAWVNTKTVKMKREISLPVKSTLRTRKE